MDGKRFEKKSELEMSKLFRVRKSFAEEVIVPSPKLVVLMCHKIKCNLKWTKCMMSLTSSDL